MISTEDQLLTETKLKRITWLSSEDVRRKFNQLMHHFNEEALLVCYQELDKNKAIGNDGVDKESYGANLEGNLKDLVSRLKSMSYIPGNIREVQIPKEDGTGKTRTLGISNFEDKIVQKMMHKVLESIYEPIFLESSFGFRPGKGMQILQEKIKDTTLLRYITRMFKAGILSKEELVLQEEGVVQGSICSPILANIFAHYVIDEWFEETVKKHCKGKVELFRYADDSVVCCEYEADANRIRTALVKRLEKYNTILHY